MRTLAKFMIDLFFHKKSHESRRNYSNLPMFHASCQISGPKSGFIPTRKRIGFDWNPIDRIFSHAKKFNSNSVKTAKMVLSDTMRGCT